MKAATQTPAPLSQDDARQILETFTRLAYLDPWLVQVAQAYAARLLTAVAPVEAEQ